MLTHPRFKPHYRVEVVPGEGVFLLSGARHSLLRGRIYEAVAPHLGAGRSADAICDRLADRVDPAEVYFALMQLERKGHLCEDDPTGALAPGEAAYWCREPIGPAVAAQRLAETRVAIEAFGIDAGPFRSLLESLGVRVGEDGKLAVVLTDDYLRDELAGRNGEALRSGRPWLLVRPVGRQMWVGPLFRPGAGACWECLAARLRANDPVEGYIRSRKGANGNGAGHAAPPETAATLQIAAGLAADAAAAWVIRGGLPDFEGKVRTFDPGTWEAQTHELIRLPHCPACGKRGGPSAEPAQPLVLQSRRKTFTSDGGHRIVAPEETLARYGRHVSPITGAVSMLERTAPAGGGEMHVYIAGHNQARAAECLAHLRSDLRSMCAGKGVTDLQAKASGLCEALERASGVFRGDEPRRTARLRDLGGAGISPADCLLFSERQYREREEWNAKASRYNFVPHPFDPDAEIEWTPLWSLTRNESRWLPTAYCWFDYPHRRGGVFCKACSNGNAAGNTVEEAILQGFLELVERDAVALWWYNRVRRPGVALETFDEPYLDRLRPFLGTHEREYWALDLTSDLGIPVFVSLSRRTAGGPEQTVMGFGAHPDPRIALLRAVTEMNQMLSYLLHVSPEKRAGDEVTDAETVRWLNTATTANQPYLLPSAEERPRDAAWFPYVRTDDVADDVRECQSVVERRGMEMLVLDQTRPEIGLPVVKVVVPGLRHFWARFAPGRLYDVPVRLGWMARPSAEEELNPIPMFL